MRRCAKGATASYVGASRRLYCIGIHTDKTWRSPFANGVSTSKSPPATQVDENIAVLRATACKGCDGVTHRRVDASRGAGIALPSMPLDHGYRHLPMALAEAQTHLQLRQAKIWLCCMRRRAASNVTNTGYASRSLLRRTHALHARTRTHEGAMGACVQAARSERAKGGQVPPLVGSHMRPCAIYFNPCGCGPEW